MNKSTRNALEGSITKWQAIVDGTGIDGGITNCPLCMKFIDRDCHGCPVREVTHRMECRGSPYDDWLNMQYKNPSPWKATTPEQRTVAQKELDFLISLRPQTAT